MERGKFIIIEGADGTGKTTFATALTEHLRAQGKKAMQLREPGGSAVSEAIRNVALSPVGMKAEGDTRMLLMFAARIQLCRELIEPALDKGFHVICDRYSMSTWVYQVIGERANSELFKELNKQVTQPDLLFLLRAPFEICYQRTLDRDQKDRNGYDDVTLGRKQSIWSLYNSATNVFVKSLNVRDWSAFDSERTNPADLANQAIELHNL